MYNANKIIIIFLAGVNINVYLCITIITITLITVIAI